MTQNSGEETPPTDKDKVQDSAESMSGSGSAPASGGPSPTTDKDKVQDFSTAAPGTAASLDASQTDTATRAARQSVVGGVMSSVKHLQDAHGEVGVIKLRSTDRATWVLLLVALGLIIAAHYLPNQNNVCTILADALMAVVLFAFLGMRFGVLRSLSARQAVLTWQLIVGSFLLGMYFAFNTRLLALMQEGTLFK